MELLGVEAVAQRLGLGRTLVRELIRDKRIESCKIGKRRLVPSDAVDEFIRRLRDEQREPVEA
jgi:excisionase family DNA binding protein